MKRLATFTNVDHILSLVDFNHLDAKTVLSTANGPVTVRIGSNRLRRFKKCRVCALCHRHGSMIALEANADDPPHLNLYAVEDDGQEVLMSFDRLENRTLCGKCFPKVHAQRAKNR
jgi:hypothetical protein